MDPSRPRAASRAATLVVLSTLLAGVGLGLPWGAARVPGVRAEEPPLVSPGESAGTTADPGAGSPTPSVPMPSESAVPSPPSSTSSEPSATQPPPSARPTEPPPGPSEPPPSASPTEPPPSANPTEPPPSATEVPPPSPTVPPPPTFPAEQAPPSPDPGESAPASASPSPDVSASPGPTASPSPTEPPPAPPSLPPPVPAHCKGWPNPEARAALLAQGRFQLDMFPIVDLGLDPTWQEDPLRDLNWQFQHHSLMAILSLLETFAGTGDVAWRDRAEFLITDWIAGNPRIGAPSVWAWSDHATARRALVLACAAPYYPEATWLRPALQLHGATLADPSFYVVHGNHALDQAIALLEVAHLLGRADWKGLASSRIATLSLESIDSQGVTNEQSVAYQLHNLGRYEIARARLIAMGLPVPASFARLGLMPNFLAHATRPDGTYEQIGDTDRMAARPIAGTWAEFAATKGASGPRPPATVAVYRAGYVFARTGWGETRPFADEVFLSQRFGPAPYIHGHADGMGITLYGYGSPLLVDAGKYSYNRDAWRTWFKGRAAHNVVAVDGLAWSPAATTKLVSQRTTPTMIDTVTWAKGYAGVSQVRRVTFSRRLGYVLVEDRAASSTRRTFRQLWHLPETANPVVGTTSFTTRQRRGNVEVRQLLGGQSMGIVKGRTAPIQGWLSYRHGERLTAPAVEVIKGGTSVRFLTLITPAAGRPIAAIRDLRVSASGYSVVVIVGGRSERVTVAASGATIAPLG